MATVNYEKKIEEIVNTLDQYGLDEVMFEVGSKINQITDQTKLAEVKTPKGRFHFYAEGVISELSISGKHKIDKLKVGSVATSMGSGSQIQSTASCGLGRFGRENPDLSPIVRFIERIQTQVKEEEKK